MIDAQLWTWSDGWILMSLYLAGRGQGVQLYKIIAAADATNHLIPTAEEMSCALTKFRQCGLIRQRKDRYSIVKEYLPSIEKAYNGRGGLFSSGDKGRKWLRKAHLVVKSTRRIEFSKAEMLSAYDQYTQGFWKT